MNALFKYAVLLLLPVTISCSIARTSSLAEAKTTTAIVQSGDKFDLHSENENLKLKREPFSIRFIKPVEAREDNFYSAAVAIMTSQIEFDKLKVGMNFEETSAFAKGTGMAAGRDEPYSYAIISSSAHHALFYQAEDFKRLIKVYENEDFIELEWVISAFRYRNEIIAIEDFDVDRIYLAILPNSQTGDTIDPGELIKLTVEFE